MGGRPIVWVFVTAAIFYLINFLVSDGWNGGADSISHFLISKYSWQHHYLLIDQWGKPVFTILFSPVAQLGFEAVVVVNIALIFVGAYWSLDIARRLQLAQPWLVVLMVLWLPVVAGNGVSALTEMVSALFLVYFIRCALRQQFVLGGAVLGFMPFARSEGFVIVALVILYYAFTRRWRFMPWLLVGSIVFNTIGFFITGKALWIFQSNPYVNTTYDMYGHGTFYHFFLYAVPLFGVVYLLWLLQTARELPGALQLLKSRLWTIEEQVWIWLIAGSSWGYFLAHTVLWWQGMWASYGLGRVMIVIAVPIALMSAKGFEWLVSRAGKAHQRAYTSALVCCIVAGPFIVRLVPLQEVEVFPQLGKEERQNVRAAAYLNEHCLDGRTKIFTGHPYLNLLLELDPYDTTKVESLEKIEHVAPGDVVVWDAHFGPNEMQLPREELDNDSSFTLLHVVESDVPLYTLNNYRYEIRVYRKQSSLLPGEGN